jgi:glutamine synthetase
MVDGVWSGGTHVCWGTDNREAPVRLCNASSPASRNFELKALDGTANPYLALAGVLGVGHVGIREGRALGVRDCGEGKSAAEMGKEGREALGIRERMPLSLEEARKRFREDGVVRGIFGEGFAERYLSVNKVGSFLSV